MNDYKLIHDASALRKLMRENPDLPIVVLAGEEANIGGYAWMYCSNIKCEIGHILDAVTPCCDIFTDRGEFEDAVSDWVYCDGNEDLPEEEFDALVRAEMAKYEPYWRKVIVVYVDN